MTKQITITDKISIPLAEIGLSAVRSSGPGGQNVNKVATKAVLRWSVVATSSLPEDVRERFMERHANRINSEGELLISSDRHRSQSRNVEECLDRLRSLVLDVLEPQVPRKPTGPSRGAKLRRLDEKKKLSAKKKSRRPVSSGDE